MYLCVPEKNTKILPNFVTQGRFFQMGEKLDKTTIDNYIFIVQVLFSLMVIIILVKNLGIELYNLYQGFWVFLFLSVFLISIGFFMIYLGKNNILLDIVIIGIDFCLISFLFIYTTYYELRFLFLIPIIISAIKLNLTQSILFSIGVGFSNLIIDLLYLKKLPLEHTIESDIVYLFIYVIIAWLVGSFVKIETDMYDNLYQTQENLEQKTILLKKLIDGMPLSIVVLDKKERIVHINQVALDFAGISDKPPEGFVGVPFKQYVDVLYNNNYNYQDLLILNALHNGKSYFKEKVLRNNIIVEGIYQPIYDIANNIVNAIGIFYDVTTEEVLNERLKNMERMTIVGQMGASIAHEIKNPLTTIKGFLQLAERSDEKLSKKHLKLLISEIERCNTILTDFLSISKKNTGKVTRYNLKEVLEGQLVLIEREAVLADIYLSVDMDEVFLKINENEIKQLFLNLTHNALDALSPGGHLYVRLKDMQETAVLEIEDDGEGIPEELIEKITTPFLTTKEYGTGLGLTICGQIAESHGATLEITSKVGKGTKAKVIFPKSEEKELFG